jgi:hypothetical protein
MLISNPLYKLSKKIISEKRNTKFVFFKLFFRCAKVFSLQLFLGELFAFLSFNRFELRIEFCILIPISNFVY